MEETPTFALPNEFLIWVAAKALANSNLDLVLTKYYKERLESRLKNRETHLNDVNSTESAVSITSNLPVPLDWISSTKPSLTRPFPPLLTPPLSPLSLPPSSAQLIAPVPCCYKGTSSRLHSYASQPTFLQSDFSSFSHPSVSTREVNQEIMATNTPSTEGTPIGPPSQVPYITPMPYPGAPDSPFFEGGNVSEFLDRFENMCDDYRMCTSEKIRRLPWYCEMFTARHVRSVISFSELDWGKICTNLKKEYKDRDITQQISSRAYLEAFKDKPRNENTEVLQFCRDYSEISKELLGKENLDKYTKLRWFLQGLPSSIQSKLINHYDIDLDGKTLPNFADILKKTSSLIETRKRMVELVTTDIRNDRMSDLVDRSAKKDQLQHPFSDPSTLSDSVFQVPIVPTAPIISATPSQNDKKIDHLTDMMQSLALSVRTLQGNAGTPSIVSQPRAQPANTSSEFRMRTDYRGADANKN